MYLYINVLFVLNEMFAKFVLPLMKSIYISNASNDIINVAGAESVWHDQGVQKYTTLILCYFLYTHVILYTNSQPSTRTYTHLFTVKDLIYLIFHQSLRFLCSSLPAWSSEQISKYCSMQCTYIYIYSIIGYILDFK